MRTIIEVCKYAVLGAIIGAVSAVLFPAHSASGYGVPNTFTPGTAISSSKINNNFGSGVNWSVAIVDTLDKKFVRFTDFADSTITKVKATTVQCDTVASVRGVSASKFAATTGGVNIPTGQQFTVNGAQHVHDWGNIATGKPTTVSGYGISDAYTKAQCDATYLPLTGGTINGILNTNYSGNNSYQINMDNIPSTNNVTYSSGMSTYASPPGVQLGMHYQPVSPTDLDMFNGLSFGVRAQYCYLGALKTTVSVNSGNSPALVYGVRIGSSSYAEYFRVEPTGRFGILTASPSTELDVNGTANATAITYNGLIVTRLKASAPASATAAGNKGEIYADASYFYICYATNSWRRVAVSSF